MATHRDHLPPLAGYKKGNNMHHATARQSIIFCECGHQYSDAHTKITIPVVYNIFSAFNSEFSCPRVFFRIYGRSEPD